MKAIELTKGLPGPTPEKEAAAGERDERDRRGGLTRY